MIATLENAAVRWGRRFGYRAIQRAFTSDDDRRRIATKRGPDQCRRRYRQAVLPDGEVYVFGEAVPRANVEGAAGNAERLQLERESTLDVCTVSDRSEEGIVRHFSRWGPVYAVAGVAVSAVGLAGLLGGI